MKLQKNIVFCFFIVLSSSLLGQDLHYSQFYNSPLNISPSLTGVFNGDQRVSASIRDQWRNVPVPWFTISLGYDQKIYLKNSKDLFFSAGAFINYDRQGDSNLNLTNINLSGSATYILTKNHLLTLGLTAGYATRGFDDSNLTWDNQWNGFEFDPSLTTGEESIDYQRYGFLENALGFNYRFQKSSRTKIDLGVGAWHLLQPDSEFNSLVRSNIKLPRRFSFYGIGTIKLADKIDLQLDGLYQLQDEYRELIFGGYFNLYLNQNRGKETNLHIGAGYRTSGSLFPKVALEYKKRYFIAASWDIDLSDFNTHTNFNGGPEVHFNYLITKVKPLEQFKVCPIY